MRRERRFEDTPTGGLRALSGTREGPSGRPVRRLKDALDAPVVNVVGRA